MAKQQYLKHTFILFYFGFFPHVAKAQQEEVQ